MQQLPPQAKLYVRLIWISGAILTLISLYLHGSDRLRDSAYPLALFLLLAVALSSRRVNLLPASTRESLATLSLGFTVVFTSLLFLQPAEALWVGLVSGISQSRRMPRYMMAFNASLLALVAYLSGQVHQCLHSLAPDALFALIIPGSTSNPHNLLKAIYAILSIIATMLIYYLLNTLGVACAIAFTTHQPVFSFWRTNFAHKFVLLSYLAGLYFALMVRLVFHPSGFWAIGFVLALPAPFIIIIYNRLFSSYLKEQREYITALSSLLEATSTLTSLRDIQELRALIVRQAVQVMPGVGASVLLLMDEEAGRLRVISQEGLPLPEKILQEIAAFDFSPEDRWVKQILCSDEAYFLDMAEEGDEDRLLPEEHRDRIRAILAQMPSIQSFIGVRLRVSDQVLGCLLFLNLDPLQRFKKHHCSLLQTFSNQVATALQNAELYSELERSYRDLKATQEQMILTEKLRALGEMAGGVAHDFNNILAGILGSAQLARRQLDQPEAVRERLKIIEQAALDAAETVKRIQDFSRQQRARRFEAMDLNDVVQGAIEITRPQWEADAQRRGIFIEMATDFAPLPPLLGNAAELREVATNLIVNAVHAMPSGGQITIRTRLQEHWAVLEVEDTGLGMSEEVQRRAFDPFFTTKGVYGTGMGLSVTYAIIRRHDGEISLRSREGMGTTFTIRLPLLLPAPDLASLEGGSLSPGHHILVIEDEDRVRAVIQEILSGFGQKVVCASDGLDGIERFKEGHYDVVLTDLGMPGLQGSQVIKQIKALSPTTPVILLTGWSGQLVGNCEVPPDMILAKPISEQELLASIAHVLPSQKDSSS